MKKFVTGVMAIALAFTVSTAQAQPEPGDAGVFADAAGTISAGAGTPFVSSFLYVVSFDLTDFNAYEFSVQGLLEAGATVAGSTLFGPNVVNIGTFPDFIVGAGGCLNGSGPIALARINYFFFASPPADTAICLEGTSLSSFASGLPGYNECANVLVEFGVAQSGGGVYPDGCFIFNPTNGEFPVDGDEASFGQVKARF